MTRCRPSLNSRRMPGSTGYGATSTSERMGRSDFTSSRRDCRSLTIVRAPFETQASFVLTRPVAALKNADRLLRDVMTAMDTKPDGKIQYEGGWCVADVSSGWL